MNQLDGEVRHNIMVSRHPTVLDREISALGEPHLRKPATEPRQAVCKGVTSERKPMTGKTHCCPDAASGHASAEPPSVAMNFRLAMLIAIDLTIGGSRSVQ
jgi:hypothetical protein